MISGFCADGECRETNESEIYKQELPEPLYDIRDRKLFLDMYCLTRNCYYTEKVLVFLGLT